MCGGPRSYQRHRVLLRVELQMLVSPLAWMLAMNLGPCPRVAKFLTAEPSIQPKELLFNYVLSFGGFMNQSFMYSFLDYSTVVDTVLIVFICFL